MTTGTADGLVAALVAAIEQAPLRELRGSQAGLVLRRVAPFFNVHDYGTSSLKEFIDRYAPQVVALRRDPDWIYGLRDGAGGELDFVDYWRTWVSPSGPAVLIVEQATGAVQAGPRSTQADAGTLIIPPAEQDVHRRIARAFVDLLPGVSEATRQGLRALTETESFEWWRAWSRALQRIPNDAFGRWRRYRVAALATELRSRLEAELTRESATAAFRAIAGSRLETVSEAMSESASIRDRAAVSPAETGVAGHSRLTELVVQVVRKMSNDELRQLLLPVGLVMDALRERT